MQRQSARPFSTRLCCAQRAVDSWMSLLSSRRGRWLQPSGCAAWRWSNSRRRRYSSTSAEQASSPPSTSSGILLDPGASIAGMRLSMLRAAYGSNLSKRAGVRGEVLGAVFADVDTEDLNYFSPRLIPMLVASGGCEVLECAPGAGRRYHRAQVLGANSISSLEISAYRDAQTRGRAEGSLRQLLDGQPSSQVRSVAREALTGVARPVCISSSSAYIPRPAES